MIYHDISVLYKRQELFKFFPLKESIFIFVKPRYQSLNVRLWEHFSKTSQKNFNIRDCHFSVAFSIESPKMNVWIFIETYVLWPKGLFDVLFLLRLSVEVDAVVVHHHDELPQVQLSVVVHVYPGHQTVDLSMGWIPTKSSQQRAKLFGANKTAVVLTDHWMSGITRCWNSRFYLVKFFEDFSHLRNILLRNV